MAQKPELPSANESSAVTEAETTSVEPPDEADTTARDDQTSQAPAAFSSAKLEAWYKLRVREWPKGKAPPSRADDERAAKAAVGATREAIRKARTKWAPESWHKTGPKLKK